VRLKSGAILIKVMTDGIELLIVEMGFGGLPAKGEQFIHELGEGEQRRTTIESISGGLKGAHFAARVRTCLENFHRKSEFRQSNGCGDARNSGSNDDGFFRHISKSTTQCGDGFKEGENARHIADQSVEMIH